MNRDIQNLITENAAAAGVHSAKALKMAIEYENTPSEARAAYLSRLKNLSDSGDFAATFVLTNRNSPVGTKEDAETYRRCLAGGIHEAAWHLSLILHSHPEWAKSSGERDELLEKCRHEAGIASACIKWFLQIGSPDENPRKAIVWLTPIAEQDDEWALGVLAYLLRNTPDIPDAETKAAAYEARKIEVLKFKAASGNSNAITGLRYLKNTRVK